MNRRPGVTLMEVLIAMFIMAIGMLALLALFPIGAVSMAQALKDDRCAAAASMAEQLAIAHNIRHDPTVETLFTVLDKSLPPTGPGQPVYVDPYFASTIPLLGQGSGSPGIHRTSLSFIPPQIVDRWFTLPDDIAFAGNGTPDFSSGLLDRGRRYSWAYLLRRAQAGSDQAINMSVVVYAGRATDIPIAEPSHAATPQPQAPNGVVIGGIVDLRRGNWILDTTPDAAGVIHGDFYRVINVQDFSTANGPATMLEVQPNLLIHTKPLSVVTIMNDVAEVFDKGTSWKP